MHSDYKENDYRWIKELLDYPTHLEDRLGNFRDTSQIQLPQDPIDCVIFQDRAKRAIRKIAQNKGHILMVGRPGTGKSMLANMFKEVLDKSLGDYLRPKESIVGYPGIISIPHTQGTHPGLVAFYSRHVAGLVFIGELHTILEIHLYLL